MKLRAGERHGNIRDERLVTDAEGNVAGIKHNRYQNTYCRRRSKKMKTGTPTAEVTIPIGNSAGRTESRAIKSASVRSVAPVNALPTIKKRLSAPPSIRKMCGTTSPTKL